MKDNKNKREDCTMYAIRSKKCNALNKCYCINEKCSFYKSVEGYPREEYISNLKRMNIEVWS